MEDIPAQILHGCELAAMIRANLTNLALQPHLLLSSCDDVVNSFNEAINGLRSQALQQLFGEGSTSLGFTPHGLHRPPEIFVPLAGQGFGMPPESVGGMIVFGVGARETKPSVQRGGEGSSMAAGSSSVTKKRSGESSAQGSSRKRKDSPGARTVLVPAPRTGNTEIPPDDGYTWRKYGQKDILYSRFPRSYYRCTHKNYGCGAKKQVQKLDEDPFTYEVTYCGEHTCHTSTAPLMIPVVPPPTETRPPAESIFPQISQSPPSLSTSIMMSTCFSKEAESSAGRGTAGPSETHVWRDADWPVADMAEAMFNSGSRGSSMDAIFSSKQEN